MKEYASWDAYQEEIYSEEGDVVGYAEYALVEKIWVPLESRKKGLGREMLKLAIKEIRDAGHETIKIAALPFDGGMDMDDLVSFYESEGFSVESTEGPAVIMVM